MSAAAVVQQHGHVLLDWMYEKRLCAAAKETETPFKDGCEAESRVETAFSSLHYSPFDNEEVSETRERLPEEVPVAQLRSEAAVALQTLLEEALRLQLGNHGQDLLFSDVTMLLWAVTVMPQPKPDILLLLFDRLEAILSLLLKEKRFLAGADNLPPQLPYPTASPIFRFLQGQLMTHCARLRAAWASLIMEGDPSLTASLQSRFPLTWTAFQLLQSEVYLAERTMLTETYLFPGFRGKAPRQGSTTLLPLVQFLLETLERHGVRYDECAFNVTIPGLPFRYNLAVPARRLVFIVGCHCAHSEASRSADIPLHSVGHIIADAVNYTPTACLAVTRQLPRHNSEGGKRSSAAGCHDPQRWEASEEAQGEKRKRAAAQKVEAQAIAGTQEAVEAAEKHAERRKEGRDADWQLVDCVIGEIQSATHSAAADARSAGGRHFIKRLTNRAGYRLVEVDTSNAEAIEALLADVLQNEKIRLKSIGNF